MVGIALIPGLLAMWLYYVGLRRTAASRATLAELAYPFTAAVVGVAFLRRPAAIGQWVGAALVVGAVTALSLHESRARVPSVVPAPTPEISRPPTAADVSPDSRSLRTSANSVHGIGQEAARSRFSCGLGFAPWVADTSHSATQ